MKTAPSIYNLPAELNMGELPFKMAIDDNSRQVAILLPKQSTWIFSDPSQGKVYEGIYKMFKDLSDRMDEASGLSKNGPKGVLVSFLKEMKRRKDSSENNKKR